jgi:diguanylate cyclase (GGDEF)-like protein
MTIDDPGPQSLNSPKRGVVWVRLARARGTLRRARIVACCDKAVDLLGWEKAPLGRTICAELPELTAATDGLLRDHRVEVGAVTVPVRPGVSATVSMLRGARDIAVTLAPDLPTESAALRQQLETARRLALTDDLTGLKNRRGLVQLLQREIARAERRKVPLTVIAIDLDGFKAINDRHGHQAGDFALQSIALILVQTCRREIDIVARLGGDEFLIALPDTPNQGAFAVIRRIEERLSAERLAVGHHRIKLAASFGVATCAVPDTVASLLQRADAALYRAKRTSPSAPAPDRPADEETDASAGEWPIAQALTFRSTEGVPL